MATEAGERWRRLLEAWAIPPAILEQAGEDPWSCPPELFAADAATPLTPSHRLAAEALATPGMVLDIGAGGGAMSAPLRSLAGRIIAVDQSQATLRGCAADIKILGRWPDVAPQVASVDVAVCGHVLYNVPDLENFLAALDAVARRRVVVEITIRHPRDSDWERTLWRKFWNLDRPTTPTYDDVLAVAAGVGIAPMVTHWESPPRGYPRLEDCVAEARRRLCLSRERDGEIRAALSDAVELDGRWHFVSSPRRLVTLSWDTSPAASPPG